MKTGQLGAIAKGVLTDTDKTGLAIAASMVDTAAFDDADTAVGAHDVTTIIEGPENGLSWLQREVFKFLSGYPTVTGDGKLSMRVYSVPTSSVDTITEDDIVGDIEWDGNIESQRNVATYRYHIDPISRTQTEVDEKVNQPSIDTYGRKPFIVKSELLQNTTAAAFFTGRQDAVLDRYKLAAPKLRLKTHHKKHLIELGDIVAVTTTKAPNRITRGRGLTAVLMEVTRKRPQLKDGLMAFELLSAGRDVATATDDFTLSDRDLVDDSSIWNVNEAAPGNIAIVSNELSLSAPGIAWRVKNVDTDGFAFAELEFSSAGSDNLDL